MERLKSMRGSVSADELEDAASDLWVTEGEFIAMSRNWFKWEALEEETKDRYRAMAAALRAVDVDLDSEIEEEER